MAYTFLVNSTPATGSIAMYQFISTLITAGWVKKMDSDGTTYSSTGVQVTHGGTGAGGLGNTNAWVRIQAPVVSDGYNASRTREFSIQRGSNGALWRIKYSAGALFTGGSPAAAVTSSSTDEVWMVGAGTDASPTFNTYLGSDGAYVCHIACGGAAENYSCIMWISTFGQVGATTNQAFALDVMQSGSSPATDVDPAVIYLSNASAFQLATASFPTGNSANPILARAWMGAVSAIQGGTAGNSVNVGISDYGNQMGGFQVNVYPNPWTSKDDLLPCLWGNKGASGPKGIKGFSTLFRQGSLFRVNGETIDTVSAGSKDKIFFNGLWLPWGGVLPII